MIMVISRLVIGLQRCPAPVEAWYVVCPFDWHSPYALYLVRHSSRAHTSTGEVQEVRQKTHFLQTTKIYRMADEDIRDEAFFLSHH
jgi:hypothetical protein